jgi:hypothetical protein
MLRRRHKESRPHFSFRDWLREGKLPIVEMYKIRRKEA